MTDEIDTSAPERIWARLSPDWHDGETGEDFVGGMFDAGHFRDGVDYVRADLYDAERDRAEKAEAERDDAIDTLKAWFDRRKLAHEDIDETVLNAARGYLRTSRSGGMPQHESDMIEGVIADMARQSVFADLFARAALRKEEDDT